MCAMDKRGGLGGGGLSGSFVMLIVILFIWGLQCFLFQLVACQTLQGTMVSTTVSLQLATIQGEGTRTGRGAEGECVKHRHRDST